MPRKCSHISRPRQRTQLQRKLHLAFALFFIFPAVGFTFFSLRYNALGDEVVPYFFLGLLAFSWMGFGIIHGLANGQPVVEELKTVTLLTIDIRGFSRMAKQLGPQRTVRLLNRFFAATGDVVFRHHGMVDKYLGDGFLAVFGAPASGNADADNALQAALEMRRCLVELNRGLMIDFGTTIQTGMSVHTGEVVAGNIGFEKKMDYTVIGDAVNTVFRMQGLVKGVVNGILISETTLGASQALFRVHVADVPQQACRDMGELIVYELLDHETRVDRVTTPEDAATRLASPLHGRQKPSSEPSLPSLSP